MPFLIGILNTVNASFSSEIKDFRPAGCSTTLNICFFPSFICWTFGRFWAISSSRVFQIHWTKPYLSAGWNTISQPRDNEVAAPFPNWASFYTSLQHQAVFTSIDLFKNIKSRKFDVAFLSGRYNGNWHRECLSYLQEITPLKPH